MQVGGLDSNGGEVILDRDSEITDVEPFPLGCSATWDLRIRIASRVEAGLLKYPIH